MAMAIYQNRIFEPTLVLFY